MLGINRLGVGDANNDGLFNNFDIGALVEKMLGGDNRGASESDWVAFWEMVTSLYARYETEEGS